MFVLGQTARNFTAGHRVGLGMTTPASVQNLLSFRDYLNKWKGSTVELDLKGYQGPLAAISALEPEMKGLDDGALKDRAAALRERATANPLEGPDLHEAMALARESARRFLGLRPYDVQVVAALALARGRVIEMQTGEGKTLAAVLTAFARALESRGVHVLTFNDYLARRDAEWMGPAYRGLGVEPAWIDESSSASDRRRAYGADVTYVTAKEAGFDHLRDLLAMGSEALRHRPFHAAIVDEADSLLIDEARIPLVIAGSRERESSSAERLARLVESLDAGVDYQTDEYGRNVELTEVGVDRVEAILGCGDLHGEETYRLLTELNCALHVHVLLKRDVDYIVREGKIEVVDEFTGRVVEDRHWPDGLQAALEAKEGLKRGADGRILGSMTLQHFLAGYDFLAGMTGTARDAAREIHDFYGKWVTVIPPHRPLARIDHPDLVFTHLEAKEAAVVREIAAEHGKGRPVLVGTLTVAESERLAQRLAVAGVSCRVLNAKNDSLEAEIVAAAGQLGAVTIATNMAGRGTDICLGGQDPSDSEHQKIVELGGLYVIGTHRNESPRIDLQLRGRAGRQGDPGESRFFVSLEDEVLVRFGIRELIPQALIPERQEAPIDNPVIRSEIARAQRIVDGQNYEIRKTLCNYATPIEEQRRKVYDRRHRWLLGLKPPAMWFAARPAEFQTLVERFGAEAVAEAELAVVLYHTDRLWSDHLSWVADVREGNHLVGLAGEDPLTRFRVETAQAFFDIEQELEGAVVDTFDQLANADQLDLQDLGIRGPSSTWTYLINDDPFRNQLSAVLSGPGSASMAIGAAMMVPVLLIAWAVVDRFFRRSSQRR